MATKKLTSGVRGRGKETRASRGRFIDELLDTIEKKLKADGKATVGEYIRLLELRREFTDDVKEIEIRWVDSLQTDEK